MPIVRTDGAPMYRNSFLEREIILVRWLNGNKTKKQLRFKARFKRRTLHVPGLSFPDAS